MAAVILGVAAGLIPYLVEKAHQKNHGLGSNKGATHPRQGVRQPSVSLPPKGYHLVFKSDFSGSHLDNKWGTCYPWVADPARGCTNYRHGEQQWFLPSQVQVHNGILSLVADPQETVGYTNTGSPTLYPYKSGMVTTYPSLRFEYGYLQIVARLPVGDQFWPALWLLPANEGALPEIDIAERVSADPNISGSFYHASTGAQQGGSYSTANLSSGWHSFGLEWTPKALIWYVDGKPELAATEDIPNTPMYFIATLAITFYLHPTCGEVFLPSCAGSLFIRSVQLWQQ